MRLHRAHTVAEWTTVASSSHTYWQRLARRTNGMVTPGNILTLVGFMLALAGLRNILDGQYWQGLLLLATGRMFDIADGLAADKTATKSPLGETLDASADKLITGLTIIVFWAVGTAPWPVLLVVLAPHLFISVTIGLGAAQGKRLHPSRIGKVSMALAWLALLSLLAVQAQGLTMESFYTLAAYGLVGLSSLLGLYSFVGYAHELLVKTD
jgi:phosphatidylglycerophosphate synthase